MQESGLPKYTGNRLYCDGCNEYFREGDMVVAWKDHVFHYPIFGESANDCTTIWKLKHKKKLLALEIIVDEEEYKLMTYARGAEEENFGVAF